METIPYFLTLFLLIFSIWTFFELKKYQNIISKKTDFIEIAIEKEKETEKKLQHTSTKIIDLEKNTNQQFLEIKVAIFNVDYTLNEIFCSL